MNKILMRAIAIGALCLAGCGTESDTNETSDTSSTSTGTTNEGTTGGGTADETPEFQIGLYNLTQQKIYDAEACEGNNTEQPVSGYMTFDFQDGGIFAGSFGGCFVGDGISDIIVEETCAESEGSWFQEDVSGTWELSGTTIDIVANEDDESTEDEADSQVTCTVLSSDALTCFGVEVEEDVDLEGNVIQSTRRCLELDFVLNTDS